MHVIGHRGAPGHRPEHTRAGYELAIAAGVWAIEPDIVFSRDGVPVVRHENEIGSTTDIAARPEFASRRGVAVVDGVEVEGWFAEDFTWEELSTLRARERLPALRPESAAHDGEEPILRLSDVVALAAGRVGVVAEIKHATTFAAAGFDVAGSVAEALRPLEGGARPLVVESFEAGVLDAVRGEGLQASLVFLVEARGAPYDLVARDGEDATPYNELVAPRGLDALRERVDGVSLAKSIVLDPARGRFRMGGGSVVADAHARGLSVYTWTARPENAFLSRPFRTAGVPGARGDYAGEWAALAAAGVDGVFVDHPDLGMAAFG